MSLLLTRLGQITDELSSLLSSVVIEEFSSDAAADVAVGFSSLGNVCSAWEMVFTRHAEVTNAWQASGAASAADYVAARTGRSAGKQRRRLATGRRLANLPQTGEKFRNGELSDTQAEEAARAGEAAPEKDEELSDFAKNAPVGELKDRCRRITGGGRSREEQQQRDAAARAKRSVRFWADPDDDAMFRGFITGSLADLAKLNARVEPATDAEFRNARREGRRETQNNYRYDALLKLLTEDGVGEGAGGVTDESSPAAAADAEFHDVKAKKPRRAGGRKSQVVVLVNHDALVRGQVIGEERCEIPGVGNISVAKVNEMLQDSILRVLVTKGSWVIGEATEDGRKISTSTMMAAVARDPVCANPLCTNTLGLQLDHRRPVSDNGPASPNNLAMLCPSCHHKKTYQGYCLVGPRGAWVFLKRRATGDGGISYPLDHDEDPNDYFPLQRSFLDSA